MLITFLHRCSFGHHVYDFYKVVFMDMQNDKWHDYVSYWPLKELVQNITEVDQFQFLVNTDVQMYTHVSKKLRLNFNRSQFKQKG